MRKNRRRHSEAPAYISPIQTIIDDLEKHVVGDDAAFVRGLEKIIESTVEPGLRSLLRFELLERHRRLDDCDAEERMLLEDTERNPDDPLRWSALANFYWLQRADFGKARSAAVKAVRVAEERDRFVVNSCNSLAHIAKDAKDYRTLSECLEAIMAYEPPPGAWDTRYERNFLRGLPAEALDTGLRARYGAFLRRSGHLRDYRPHNAIARFRPVVMLVQERGGQGLTDELVERAEAARHLVRDMGGVPDKIAGSDDVVAAILELGSVISEQLVIIRDTIRGIEDDRVSHGIDHAELLAFEKFRVVKGRYFRRHGRDELKRYIASMRAGEFDDW